MLCVQSAANRRFDLFLWSFAVLVLLTQNDRQSTGDIARAGWLRRHDG